MPSRLSATFHLLNLGRYDLRLLSEGELLEQPLRDRADAAAERERCTALLARANRHLPV